MKKKKCAKVEIDKVETLKSNIHKLNGDKKKKIKI